MLAILLGAGVTKENKISPHAKKRAKKTLSFINEGKISKVILSGGRDPERKISEARIYYNYLVSRGVNPKILILEEKSRDTIGNAIYTKRLIQKMFSKEKKFILITNKFHMKRALMIFKHIYNKKYEIIPEAARDPIKHKFRYFKELRWHKQEKIVLKKLGHDDKKIEAFIKEHLDRYKWLRK